MKRRVLWTVGMAVLVITVLCFSTWAVPPYVNYQGSLVDKTTGNPVTDPGLPMTFRIYDAQFGGTLLWEEDHASVPVQDGIYNVLLGNGTAMVGTFDPTIFSADDRWFEVEVDSELCSPRQRVASVAFAMKAAVAESVKDGAIETINLADDAVTGDKIDDGAVLSSHIQDGATISEILDDDGAGSGLDSDLLDGQESNYYRNANNINAGTLDNARFSAHADLAAEGYLGNASGDLAQNNGTVQMELNADKLDGLHASAFSSSSHNHDTQYYTESESDSRFVNVAGDSMSGSSSGSVLSVTNGGTGHGVHGEATGTLGVGVYGEAFGGIGVYGEAPYLGVKGIANTTGDAYNYGGRFEAYGKKGYGVYGWSAGSDGYGVCGEAVGANARAVYGNAYNTGDVTNYGGYFEAGGISGHGVYGLASNTADVVNYGGYFEARGSFGSGVYGLANGDVGKGVFGKTPGREGLGVFGYASADSGRNYGVYGRTDSSGGYGGYFAGRGYFSGSVGIGAQDPGAKLHVRHSDSGLTPDNNTGLFVENNGMGNEFFVFQTATTGGGKSFSITNAGRVGIGTTSPGTILDVNGRARMRSGADNSAGIWFMNTDDSENRAFIGMRDDDSLGFWGQGVGWGLYFNANTGNVRIGYDTSTGYKLAVNGSAAKPGGGVWSTISDARLKDIGERYEHGLADITKIEPVKYRYKEDNALGLPSDGDYVGLIAQEVQEVIPEAVEQNEQGYLMLNGDPINYAMLNAIKELSAEVKRLKKRIEELEKDHKG